MGRNGVACIELSGELVTYDLATGESIMVHPGHVGLCESSVNLDITMICGIKNIVFGADTLFLAMPTGPGRVYLQSLALPGLAYAMISYLPLNEGGGGGDYNLKIG